MNDEYLIYGETLTNIANSIRSVSNVSTTWTPDEMAAYILANLVKPTTRQAAKTYTPSTSNQTIPAGTFLTGAATIQGDADWTEGNIKKGVNMWGKTGTLSGIWGTPDTFYGFTAVKSGSFTISGDIKAEHTVTHNLGVVPIFVMLFTSNNISVLGYNILCSAMAFQTCSNTYIAKGNKTSSGVYFGANVYDSAGSAVFASSNIGATRNTYTMTSTSTSNDANSVIRKANASSFSLLMYSSNSYYIGKGTYSWIAMA